MEGIWMYVWLIVGFVLLIKGADFFVDGTSSIAGLLKVPSIIIGLTIVAFGTSAPEMAVSVSAALKGDNDIVISNILGSNLFNLLVVAGSCAAIKTLPVSSDIKKRDFPLSIIVALGLMVLIFDGAFVGSSQLVINRLEGAILFIGLILYLIYLVYATMKGRNNAEIDDVKAMSAPKSIFYTLLGIAGIVCGGDLTVDAAAAVAETFGMSDTIIGLTVLAVGTSLPELVTSLVATKKGENDLAMGNVIGSNIFNMLGVAGLSAAISPVTISVFSVIDLAILIVFSFGVFWVTRAKDKLSRMPGVLMIITYIIYMAYAILREVM